MAKPDSGVKFQEDVTNNTPSTSTSTPYQIQEFNESDYKRRILDSQFNYGKSKKDKRKFDEYMNSDEGKKAMLVAKQRHDASEQSTAQAFNQAATLANKYKAEFNKIGQETAAYEQNYWNENKDALQKQGWSYTPDTNSAWRGKWSKQTPTAPVSIPEQVKPELTFKVDWNAEATKYGFKDMDAVKAWQAKNGLVADGKFGPQSRAKKQELDAQQPMYNPYFYTRVLQYQEPGWSVRRPEESAPAPVTPAPTPTPAAPAQETPLLTVDDYKNSKYFRGVHFMTDDATVTIDGKKYPIFVIQNRYTGTGKKKEENDRTYAVDPETGKMRRVYENWIGIPYNRWSTDEGGEDWFYPSFMAGSEYEWTKANPMPSMRGPLGGGLTPEYKKWLQDYKAAKAAGFKKQGGTMNRIKYFQQGGAAPQQQDIQQQVVALVQAAMQGDQKAKQTVSKIIEAAEKGDQQAAQIAQMIQQVVQQMQGQATAAKWGAKLGYIRSLKFANGGKACPACQAGAPMQKVEEKACGGKAKKAKKRYFGGWL